MRYSIWIWGKYIGWWLHEEGYDNVPDACASLAELIGKEEGWHGGCVLPDGTRP